VSVKGRGARVQAFSEQAHVERVDTDLVDEF
jgi:hypothetical protein